MMREVELVYRPRPDLPLVDARKQITVASDIADLVLAALACKTLEVFLVLALDTKHRVTGDIELRAGTLDASLVHPRDVFGWAVAVQASALILAHNHPSGDPEPSDDDISLTTRLQRAGEILGITILDHVIVGSSEFAQARWVSLRETGRL